MNANENQMQVEVLQPEISGQIKQTNLEELRIWIKDGKLLPHHQVKIKNLAWIEAQKIPAFKALFESIKINQKDISDHSKSPTLPEISVSKKNRSETDGVKKPSSNIKKTTAKAAEKPLSKIETKNKANSKAAEPSAVFKAFEEKVLTKSKPVERKKQATNHPPKTPKKFAFVKQMIGFLAGCILAFLLSFGGSYLWVHQLKAPVEIDEKSLPEMASLDARLTSDKLDLRFREAAKEQKLKESGTPENQPQQPDISQQIAQLEKQYDTRRKAVVENHRDKLKDFDFTTTFSFSFAVLLALFLLLRIFYGKNFQPIGNHRSSKLSALPIPEPLTIPANGIDKEISQRINLTETVETENEQSAETISIKPAGNAENSDNIIKFVESSDEIESTKSVKCFQHQKIAAKFVCEKCEFNFCEDCVKTFDETENCCPLCNVVCRSVEDDKNKTVTPQSKAEEKKKINLLELGHHKNFIVYDYADDRTRKLGIIPAFIIAVFFSTSISILWVYKISPYPENRSNEISQNASPNEAKNTNPTADKNTAIATVPNSNAALASSANKSCIDPETRQPFECDEQTRQALYEHTRKVESAEKAQKETAEKTNLILGTSPANSSAANENRESPNAVRNNEPQVENAKEKLIKTFGISFFVIFGLLLLTRFFSKAEN